MTRDVATGDFVAQFINDGDVPEKRIQPNGVDLVPEDIFKIKGKAVFNADDSYEKPERIRMEPLEGYWRLYKGVYAVVYDGVIEIPEGYVGRVYPRSRLMRSGLHLTSALWDQGYRGVGEGQLRIARYVEEVQIEQGTPIAQMVFQPATEPTEQYDGTHQHERTKCEVTD